MTASAWMPLIPIRFVERDGKKILQQAWGEHVLGFAAGPHGGREWQQTGRHEWRDVPLMPENQGDPHYWSQSDAKAD